MTNKTRAQASSLPAALTAIDKALCECQRGLNSLASRGKCSLPAYKALQAKHAALARKRADLAGKQLRVPTSQACKTLEANPESRAAAAAAAAAAATGKAASLE